MHDPLLDPVGCETVEGAGSLQPVHTLLPNLRPHCSLWLLHRCLQLNRTQTNAFIFFSRPFLPPPPVLSISIKGRATQASPASSLDLFPSLFCHPIASLSPSLPLLSIPNALVSHKPSMFPAGRLRETPVPNLNRPGSKCCQNQPPQMLSGARKTLLN